MTAISAPAAGRVEIASQLPVGYRGELEQLLFFNPGQERISAGIEESIRRHGVPEVIADGDGLYIAVGALGRVQTLYAMLRSAEASELAGVVVFCRPAPETLVVLHLAASERCAAGGVDESSLVVVRLFQAVRQVARALKGITRIVMYGAEGPQSWIVK